MTSPVHIVATGARTPLGIQAAASAAGFRAGLSAVREHPFMIDRTGQPMQGALDSSLDPGLIGADRLVSLAETALREACAPLMRYGRTHRLRAPILVALPEPRPGFTTQDVDAIRARLSRIADLPLEVAALHLSTDGHAGALSLLGEALASMREQAFDACLVGGIDSYFHPDTMEWLDENRQLAGTDARSAFVPGEGAGFCLLMNERLLAQMGLGSLGLVRTVATGWEDKRIKTADVCLGVGLGAVVERAVQPIAPHSRTINTIICDVNGERYRGEEWGFVCVRLAEYFDDPTGYWSPADCWGDTGAASGALFITLACQAASRGYANGPLTLVWAGSEAGLRGAAVLETTNDTERLR